MVDTKQVTQLKTSYNGYDITLDTDRSWRFFVVLDGEEVRADSLNEIHTLVDKHIIAQERAQRENVKEKFEPIAVVSERGKSFTITGIHASNFNLMYKPKKEKYASDDRDDYIDTPVVRKLIDKRLQLLKQAAAIEDQLSGAEIEAPSGTYGATYSAIMRGFLGRVKAARAGAEKLTVSQSAAAEAGSAE